MIMRSIRNKKRAFRVPMIIFTVALSISLVGFFTHSPIDVGHDYEPSMGDEIQNMLAYSKQLEQAIAEEPENEELQVSLGNILYDVGIMYASMGDHELADRYLKDATEPYGKALEIDPDLTGARVDLATAAYYSGLNELAAEHFQEAIQREPDFINGRINYGHFLFFAQEDVDGALEQWEAALALEPEPATKDKLEGLIKTAREQQGK